MSEQLIIDPNIEDAVLGEGLTDPKTAGFIVRHETLVKAARYKLIGAVSLLNSAALESDSATAPSEETIGRLKEELKAERTLLCAVRAIDAQRQDRDKLAGEEHLPHQQDVLDDILKSLSEGHKEGYVELATATGKTYLIAKLADALALSGLRVLILAPTKEIAKQTIGQDGEKGIGKFASQATQQATGRQFGDSKAKPTDAVVVSTYQALNRFIEDGRLGEFDVVLCDEAHRALGEVTSNNLSCAYPHAIKLGFTATPTFGINKSVKEILPTRIHRLNLREAIDNGIVAPMQCLIYGTGKELPVLDPGRKDFTERELQRLINLKSRNEKALTFAHDLIQDGRQGIIACVPGANLAHARLLAEKLCEREITDKQTGEKRKIVARAVGSSIMSDRQQTEILRQYESGDIDVLTFVNVLGEGWDSQRASFLINACPTTSIVRITQYIGRVARIKADGTHSIVIDFVDEIVGKEQKTALHALGEETIRLTKVYGFRNLGREYTGEKTTYLQGLLNPDLYNELMSVEGRLITDLTLLKPKRRDRLTADYFDHKLEKEGLHLDAHLMGVPLELIAAIEEAEGLFYQENAREASTEDLVELLDTRKLFKKADEIDVKQWVELARYFMNLETLGLDFDRPELMYDPFDANFGDPQEIENLKDKEIAIASLMSARLDERERLILELRYGLGNNRQHTLDEVAEFFGLVKERIRQIESKALSKLKIEGGSATVISAYCDDYDCLYRPDDEHEEVNNLHVRLFRKFSQESLGLQVMVVNLLSPYERAELLKTYRHHFRLPIQEHLQKLNKLQADRKAGIQNFGRSYWNFGIAYHITKNLLDGRYNAHIRSLPLPAQLAIGNFVFSIPKHLLANPVMQLSGLKQPNHRINSRRMNNLLPRILLELDVMHSNANAVDTTKLSQLVGEFGSELG